MALQFDECDPQRLLGLMEPPDLSPAEPLREAAGTRVGRYKLLQLIGEGGFGSVFMAEQETPVRRRVALKIIKLGMDTKQVIARFEAERQALAMMDHPNIAKVLDAGATETGRPYFVMELVRGMPITAFCDENKLTTPQRLELFIPICSAVQHAHQKGIIHRDLKPNNVLVTMHDDKPVPVIIDFGIAKATNARLTEHTLFTEFRQFVGTPQYMSPEQAQLSALDVDTRSDIYSLGVLLYELLTGTTPFDAAELRRAAYAEMQRIIREIEPATPSTRLGTMAVATQTIVAGLRRCDPGALARALRGDLDWIIMKCLEKDRSRRYETASGLGRDVQRYLSDEPVEASPPSTVYKLRKLARKHRKEAVALLAIAAALVLGIVGTSLGLAGARANLAAAQASQHRAQQITHEMEIEKDSAAANERVARQAVRRMAARYVPLRELFRGRVGGVASASEQLDRLAPSDPRRTDLLLDRGMLYLCLDRSAEAKSDLVAVAHTAKADSAMLQYAGSALAYVGQVDEYREICRVMISRFGGSDSAKDLERTIKTSLLIANATGLEPKQCLARMDRLPASATTGEWLRLTRSLALYRIGDFSGCIESARNISSPYPGCEPLAHLIEGMALSRLGRTAQASAAYARAQSRLDAQYGNASLPVVCGSDENWLDYQILRREAQPNGKDAQPDVDALRDRAEVYIESKHFDLATADLNQAIGITSQRIRAQEGTSRVDSQFASRAELFARVGNFKEAVADYRRAVELAPEEHTYWHDGLVPLLLELGDAEAYRHWRSQELRQFRGATGDAAHRVAKDAFMLPLDGEELKIAMQLADNAFKDDVDLPWAPYQTKGMAEYRSGHFREAISALLRFREATEDPKFVPEAEFLLAMSYERANDHRSAQAAFARGVRAVSQLPNGGESCIGVTPPVDWVLTRLLRREAEGLIQSK